MDTESFKSVGDSSDITGYDNKNRVPLPITMQAMVMESAGQPLVSKMLPLPVPNEEQVLVHVIACGVCRTDLHIIDSELARPKLPLILGHEIIGTIEKTGSKVTSLKPGDLIGIPWLGYTCGHCKYCLKGLENLRKRAFYGLYNRWRICGIYSCFRNVLFSPETVI